MEIKVICNLCNKEMETTFKQAHRFRDEYAFEVEPCQKCQQDAIDLAVENALEEAKES